MHHFPSGKGDIKRGRLPLSCRDDIIKQWTGRKCSVFLPPGLPFKHHLSSAYLECETGGFDQVMGFIPAENCCHSALKQNTEVHVAPFLDSAVCFRQKESSKSVECAIQVKGLQAVKSIRIIQSFVP